MDLQRLDKVVASACGCTRSQARDMIKQSRISVNGKVIKDSSFKIDTQADMPELDGKKLKYEKYVYYIMNKPKGVLSASRDKSAKTVLDLILPQDRRADLFCVGRLDKDTTGLLIVTDDGETAHKLMSPKSDIDKVYKVTLDGEVTDDMVKSFENGVVLADGIKCKPAVLQPIKMCQALITISEGKYHQVKRMFGTVGLGVVQLERLSIGTLSLPQGLKQGEYVKAERQSILEILG